MKVYLKKEEARNTENKQKATDEQRKYEENNLVRNIYKNIY